MRSGQGQAICLIVYALSVILSIKRTMELAAARAAAQDSVETQAYYKHKRLVLSNHKWLRVTYVCGAIVYVAALTCSQIPGMGQLTVGQVVGVLLSYLVVACVCCTMGVMLVPALEPLLVEYTSILALIVFTLYSLYCNYAHSLGMLHGCSHWHRMLSYNLFWLLEDVPLGVYGPPLAAMGLLHAVTQWQWQGAHLDWRTLHAGSLVTLLLRYGVLAVLLPMVMQRMLRHVMQPARLPTFMFLVVCAFANLSAMCDMALSMLGVADGLQDAAHSGLFPQLMVNLVQGEQYGYGPQHELLTSLSLTLLASTVIAGLAVLLIYEGPSNLLTEPQRAFLAFVKQSPLGLFLINFLRQLSPGRLNALVLVPNIMCLQGLSLTMLGVNMALSGGQAGLANAPVVLLTVLVGVLAEVLSVFFIIIPSIVSSPDLDNDDKSALVSATPVSMTRTPGSHQASLSKPSSRNGMSEYSSISSRSFLASRARRSSREYPKEQDKLLRTFSDIAMPTTNRSSISDIDGSDGWGVSARMEALSNYKLFMQSSDMQAGTYSLEEFLQGTSNAMRGVFPTVHNASFCLLTASLSVNMYTLIGEGSHKPRLGVSVAPGTLIYHVLNHCQPAFITNIISFPGPYSDVQFMRFVLNLKSVACLPLVAPNGHMLGVLRLGFEDPYAWGEQEKGLAKQLAFVLSSGSSSMAARSDAMPGVHYQAPESRSISGVRGSHLVMPSNAGSDKSQQQLYLKPSSSTHSHGNSVPFAQHSHGNTAMATPTHHQQASPSSTPPYILTSQGTPFSGGVLSSQSSLPISNQSLQFHTQQQQQHMQQQQQQHMQHQQQQYLLQRMQQEQQEQLTQEGLRLFNTAGPSFRRPTPGFPPGAPSSVSTSPAQGSVQAAPNTTSSDLKIMEVIGRGGFGSVYKAMWRSQVVAVKVLEHGDDFEGCNEKDPERKLDTSGRRAALLEGAMTSTINHPNVVSTYDYRVVNLAPQPMQGLGKTRISQETHIIMEWCDRGSLQDAIDQGVFFIDKALRTGTDVEVDIELLVMTLAEVSSAMEYLHAHRITHRDLKPKNVLLRTSRKDKRGFCAKVSDFGLSQVLPDSNTRTQVSQKYSGTVTHMPPELIEDGKVYPQGDVYAFGIMMWEAYTGGTPYLHMAHPQIMVAVVTHNLRPRFPESCPEWFKSLAYKCWRKDPKMRPGFGEVTSFLAAQVPDKGWHPVEGRRRPTNEDTREPPVDVKQ